MPLPATGPISLGQIAAEFGGTAPHSLSEYYGKAAGIPASGEISFSQFHGKTAGFHFNPVISTDTSNYNLKAAAIAAGWNQTLPLIATVTINSGIVVSANATGAYAFDTGSGFPAGSSLALINNGYVIGMGGAGGDGQIPNDGANVGKPGGPALRAQVALTVTNNGTIGGGGGGGGGGQGDIDYDSYGGGGGRTGRTNSAPGGPSGRLGNPGTFAAAGASRPNDAWYYGSGAGGDWGASGGKGSGFGVGGWAGGSGGAAVMGNSNITWVVPGTRMGALT